MNVEEAREWLEFARRDIRRAYNNASLEDYPLAAYLLQQAAEKSLKAVIILYGEVPPRTHNIRALIGVVKKFVEFPKELEDAAKLTRYAFDVRYPDDYRPVSEEEYEEAYEVAVKVYEWAKGIVEGQP